MLVCLPFWQKDIEQAINLIRWMRELDGPHKVHRALLISDYGMPQEQIDRVAAAAYDTFGTVFQTKLPNPELRGWPMGVNACFVAACAYNRQFIKEDFWWNETDCIPLKKGWLDTLQAEYKKEKQPFMGFVHSRPWLHMTGCGIYPWNLYEINPQILMANTEPFDVVNPQTTLAQCHVTKLIHHVWSFEGFKKDSPAPTFPTRQSMAVISPDAVIFHRNKDHTLIDRLRGKPTNTPIYLKGDVCLLQLGRFGDIINILPVAKRIADTYGKPALMVAKQFADVLDAVSYVHPCVFDGDFGQVEKAIEIAQAKFELVIVSQVWGHTWRVPHLCETYNIESWRMAGFLNSWNDPTMKLVLDKVAAPLKLPSRPSICLSLSSGHSSPFAQWEGVQEHVTRQHGDAFDVIDLAQMHCDRVYDLLKWIRSARLLITSDTATLHLAAACRTPVISLVNDDPWLGSTPRCNCVLRLRYSEALSRLDDIDKVIAKHASVTGSIRNMIGVMA